MPRAYIRAGTRLRQLERLVRAQYELTGKGVAIPDLVGLAGISYQSVCAYMQRLTREQRVDVVLLDVAASARSAGQLFYPKGQAPKRLQKAA